MGEPAERIVAMRVPDAEQVAAGGEHAIDLGIGFGFVRKEHHTELAHDGVEASIREWKRRCISLPELDLLAGSKFRAGNVQHRRIEIGCSQMRVSRQGVAQPSVTMPVPAAVSSTRAGLPAATRRAMSAA